MATYRTKTYIAGDWTGDKEAIEKIYKWKESDYWGLDFVDAHDLTQARDSSLPCSIKSSLKKRLDVSKTFVLIVGEKTKNLTKGSCAFCNSYNSYLKYCVRGYSLKMESFIEFECEQVVKDDMRIVVIYNSTSVNYEKCPDILKDIGVHIPLFVKDYGGYSYNYQEIKKAIMG